MANISPVIGDGEGRRSRASSELFADLDDLDHFVGSLSRSTMSARAPLCAGLHGTPHRLARAARHWCRRRTWHEAAAGLLFADQLELVSGRLGEKSSTPASVAMVAAVSGCRQ